MLGFILGSGNSYISGPEKACSKPESPNPKPSTFKAFSIWLKLRVVPGISFAAESRLRSPS